MLRSFATLLACAFFAASPALALETGQQAPDFTAKDQNGKTVKLSDFKGSPVILEWNNPECPFVVKHYETKNMQKLQDYARSKNAVWLVVNSSADGMQGNLTEEKAQKLVADKGMSVDHYLLDADGAIGRMYGAKTTPHMFVIDRKGVIAYMGAIDDKPSTDKKDVAGATNYVQIALDSILRGERVELASTEAYGCGVKYKN